MEILFIHYISIRLLLFSLISFSLAYKRHVDYEQNEFIKILKRREFNVTDATSSCFWLCRFYAENSNFEIWLSNQAAIDCCGIFSQSTKETIATKANVIIGFVVYCHFFLCTLQVGKWEPNTRKNHQHTKSVDRHIFNVKTYAFLNCIRIRFRLQIGIWA